MTKTQDTLGLMVLGLGAFLLFQATRKRDTTPERAIQAKIRDVRISLAGHLVAKHPGDAVQVLLKWEAATTRNDVAIDWDYRLHLALGTIRQLGPGPALFIPIGASATTFNSDHPIATLGITATIDGPGLQGDQEALANWTIPTSWPLGTFIAAAAVTAWGVSPDNSRATWPFDQDWGVLALQVHEDAAVISARPPAPSPSLASRNASITEIEVSRRSRIWYPIIHSDGRRTFVSKRPRRRR